MKQPCRATGSMPLLQWFLELFGYKPKDKFATPSKKKRPSKLRPDTFDMFWKFFHQYSYVNKLNLGTCRGLWDQLPQHVKDKAYDIDTVKQYRKRNIQCDVYLKSVEQSFNK